VMQLVEQGKLDLDRDVNDYLDFKIPATYPKPITLRNIMTHTPGFEETIKELFVGDAKDLTPLRHYLEANLPKRIYPPGATPAYSNYATTLAGYIVQRVSGEPYESYVEEHILKPLGMNSTTFRQPLPDALKTRMSNGYNVASEEPRHFEFVEGAPAGACSTTATDMAHFMIAHLQYGQYEGAQILRPETPSLGVEWVEQHLAGLAFEAREAMLEPRLGPPICRRCDRPYLVRATEFGERVTRDRQRPSRLAGFMLVVDCQLLVSFVALARVSQRAFPKLSRECEVPVTLCQSR